MCAAPRPPRLQLNLPCPAPHTCPHLQVPQVNTSSNQHQHLEGGREQLRLCAARCGWAGAASKGTQRAVQGAGAGVSADVVQGQLAGALQVQGSCCICVWVRGTAFLPCSMPQVVHCALPRPPRLQLNLPCPAPHTCPHLQVVEVHTSSNQHHQHQHLEGGKELLRLCAARCGWAGAAGKGTQRAVQGAGAGVSADVVQGQLAGAVQVQCRGCISV